MHLGTPSVKMDFQSEGLCGIDLNNKKKRIGLLASDLELRLFLVSAAFEALLPFNSKKAWL